MKGELVWVPEKREVHPALSTLVLAHAVPSAGDVSSFLSAWATGLTPKVQLQCTSSSKLSTISHPPGSNPRKIRERGILEVFPEEVWPERQFQVRPCLLESGTVFAVCPPPTCGYIELTPAVKSTYPCL